MSFEERIKAAADSGDDNVMRQCVQDELDRIEAESAERKKVTDAALERMHKKGGHAHYGLDGSYIQVNGEERVYIHGDMRPADDSPFGILGHRRRPYSKIAIELPKIEEDEEYILTGDQGKIKRFV